MYRTPLRSIDEVEVGEWVIAIDSYHGRLEVGKPYQVVSKDNYNNRTFCVTTPRYKELSAYPFRFTKQYKLKSVEELL